MYQILIFFSVFTRIKTERTALWISTRKFPYLFLIREITEQEKACVLKLNNCRKVIGFDM